MRIIYFIFYYITILLIFRNGAFDGATSISEMAEMLDERAEEFRRLRDEEGWELENEVDDGFAYLVKGK